MIRIIAVGRIKDNNIKGLVEMYKKRISLFIKIQEIEVKAEKDRNPGKRAIEKETRRILKVVKKENFKILLDRRGKMLDSVGFAKFLQELIQGGKDIDFVIGGAWGVSEDAFREFNFMLSLSKMTFPHEITRLLVLEQVYRAFTILKGTGYHK